MLMKNSKYAFIILFFICYLINKIENSEIKTQNQNSCIYHLSNGSLVDLSSLRKSSDYIFPVGRYIYKANFCGNLIDKCGSMEVPASIYIKRKINKIKIIFLIKNKNFKSFALYK